MASRSTSRGRRFRRSRSRRSRSGRSRSRRSRSGRSRSRSSRRSRSRSSRRRGGSGNVYYLSRSTKPDKKYMIQIDNKTIHFGAAGMSDYTKHKDAERKGRYMSRHNRRESWSKGGIRTAGFWSRWLLWNKPSLTASIQDTQRRFRIKIRRGRQ